MHIPVELIAVLLAAILAVSGFSLKLLWQLSERVTKLEEHWQYLPWLMMSAANDARASQFPNPNQNTKHEKPKHQVHPPQFNPLPGGAD